MDFGANQTGTHVSAGFLYASNGKLYGMTSDGGNKGDGNIFTFDPATNVYTDLKDFNGADGAHPYGGLIEANDGKFYGMTSVGGNMNDGVIFSFDPTTSVYTKLSDFDFTDGANPYGSLVQASNGLLYGVTSYGGFSLLFMAPYGVIFSYDPVNNIYTKLYDFIGDTGADPYGSLVEASDGKLYGLTSYKEIHGDNHAGVIFSFDPSNNSYADVKEFDYTNGATPYGSFIKAKDNKLYATTSSGGANNFGVIFSYDPASSTFTKLYDFDGTNGADPLGNLLQADDGKFYGMTGSGGSDNAGVIFSMDTLTFTYTKLADFNKTNGANPSYGSAFVEVPESGPLPVTIISFEGKNNGGVNQLSWKVVNDHGVNYYEVQRSNNGQTFEPVTQIKETGSTGYSFNDNIDVSVASAYYYRLKCVDADGNFRYSNVVKLYAGSKGGFVIINPNPFRDKLMITLNSAVAGKITFVLSDINGKKLYRDNQKISKGTNVIGINETNKLNEGVYILTVITGQQSQTFKIVKGN